jgi:hypothetical protein
METCQNYFATLEIRLLMRLLFLSLEDLAIK